MRRFLVVGWVLVACSGSQTTNGKPDAAVSPDAPVSADATPIPDAPELPSGWTCADFLYGDGTCDCGCGAPDVDCGAQGCTGAGCQAAGCEYCNGADAGDGTFCVQGWTCDPYTYRDGECDCGCGVPDPDCNGGGCTTEGCKADACINCTDTGGIPFYCEKGWTCPPAAHGDFATCDCGCGLDDPDCASGLGCSGAGCSAPLCQTCHDASGNPVACTNNWKCDPAQYGDGFTCNCGCGIADPDCGTGGCTTAGCSDSACEVCNPASGPETVCVAGWDNAACGVDKYEDGLCDCGCGAADPDCNGMGCTTAGCFDSACLTNTGWTCDPYRYNDGVCDCGCGAVDPDCGSTTAGCASPDNCRADACVYCNDTPTAAMGPATFCLKGWTCDPSKYGDGTCDCTCGKSASGAPLDLDCGVGDCP